MKIERSLSAGDVAHDFSTDVLYEIPSPFRNSAIARQVLGGWQIAGIVKATTGEPLKVTQTGGDVSVLPTNNPDQLALLQNGGVDAVWTVEPWVTRLEREAKARIFLEDKDVITTWLVSSVNFLNSKRDLTKKIAAANIELTDWIQKNADEAQKLLIDELKAETRTTFAPEDVAQAWKRINFRTTVPNELVTKAVQDGKDAGFFKGNTDTSKLIEVP